MGILTVTAKGQVTLRREALHHLGVAPGDKLEFELLPDGRGLLHAAKPAASMDDFVGLLSGRKRKVASLEAIDKAIARGWAGRR